MAVQILATKLYIPPSLPGIVPRPRLTERLNEGLAMGHKMTLISASAGYGKTTLISEWIATCERSVAWLSLDEGDSDPARFTSYLVKALQTIKAEIGENLFVALQSNEPLDIETIVTALLNEISIIPEPFLLILDDHHSIDSQQVNQSLAFLIEHRHARRSIPAAGSLARSQSIDRVAHRRFTLYPSRISRVSQPCNGIKSIR